MGRWLQRPIAVVRVGEGALLVAFLAPLLPRSVARGLFLACAGTVVAVVAGLVAFNVDGFLDRLKRHAREVVYTGPLAIVPASTWRFVGFCGLFVGAIAIAWGVSEL